MLLNLRTTFDAPTGDSADRCIYSWGINGPVPDAAGMQALADAVEAAHVDAALEGAPAGWMVKDLIQVGYRMAWHEVFDAQGGPALGVINATNNPDTVGTASAGPTEVQLCVSRLINTPRGLTPVGRIYIGPIGSAAGLHPTNPFKQTAVGWAKRLHENLAFVGYTPEVIAKAGTPLAAGKPIAGYRVDALWDTQRRRGIAQAPFDSALELTV